MRQRRLKSGLQHNANGVHSDAGRLHAMLTHPHRGQLTQRPHLRVRNRLKRMAETQTATTLHLTKDQRDSLLAGLRSDNVDPVETAGCELWKLPR
jgi:hypothetical protein